MAAAGALAVVTALVTLAVLVVVVVVLASVAIGNVSDGIDMMAVRTFLNDHTVAIAIGGCVVSVALYVVSAFIAARLYQAREL